MGKMALVLGSVVGAGAIYFVNSKRGSSAPTLNVGQATNFAQQAAQQVQSQASTVAGTVKSKATDVAGTVKSKATGAAGTAKDTATNAAQTAAAGVSSARQQASKGGQSAAQQAGTNRPDNANPDDTTLRDRVESEILGRPNVSKGDINIDVINGVVELRGQLKQQSDIDTLIAEVRAVPHVKDVRSFLHLPGTPAPNKESAIDAS